MLLRSLGGGAAALDAAAVMSSGAGGGGAALEVSAATAHWSLDTILWNPDTMTAAPAPPGSVGGTLRPALLPAPPAAAAPKAATVAPRRASTRAPACQALGCGVSLDGAGAYCLRSKLCGAHMRAEQLQLSAGGPPLRFCQKCNRCHSPEAFDGLKRTCTAQLNAYNARRRARLAAARDAQPAGTGTSSDADAAAAAAPRRRNDSSSGSGSGCADADLSLLSTLCGPGAVPEIIEADVAAALECGEDLLDALLRDMFAREPAPQPAPGPAPAGASAEGFDALFRWPPPLAAATVELKVGGSDAAAAPDALPAGLRDAASRALFATPPLALHAAVAPGCTLLTFDAFVAPIAGEEGCESDAEAALAALLCAPDGIGAYFRTRESVSVAAGGRVATARFGAMAAGSGEAAPPPRLPRLSVLAAAIDAATPLAAAPGEAPLPPAAALRCRVHGRMLSVQAGPALAACPEEGVALLDASDGGVAAPFAPRGAPRPLLLTADADVAAELNAWATSAAATVPPPSAAAWEAAEAATTLLGAASRPNAPAELLAAACGAAMALRWRAAAAAPLRRLAALGAEALRAQAGPACAALLLAAVRAADVATLRAVLAAGGPACALGAAGAAVRCAGGGAATPLHAAAALRSAAQARAACAELTRCDAAAPAGADAGADAAVAWLYALDSAGRTPSDVAARHGDAALAALDAQLRADVAAALPAARAAAAAARERYAALHAPHAAELACGLLSAATDAAGAAAARRAAIAGALLRRAAAAAAERAEDAAAAAETAAAARRPAARLRTALRGFFRPTPLGDAEAAWRFAQFRTSILQFCLFQLVYHAGQAQKLFDAPPAAAMALTPLRPAGLAAPGVPFLVRQRWADYAAAGSQALSESLWYQLPATAALVAALLSRRAHAALARRLQPVLAVQYMLHVVLCTMTQCDALHAALEGRAVMMFPYRMAMTCAIFTLFVALMFPLRPRWALLLLVARGGMPVVNLTAPTSRLGLMWPATGAAGVRLQLAACAVAAAHAVWRERRLRDAYARHLHAAAAAKAKQA